MQKAAAKYKSLGKKWNKLTINTKAIRKTTVKEILKTRAFLNLWLRVIAVLLKTFNILIPLYYNSYYTIQLGFIAKLKKLVRK